MKTTHKIFIIFTAIIVIAACVVVSLRWNAWFGNPTEEKYTSPSTQDRIILSYTPNGKGISISWRHGEPLQNAAIEYYSTENPDTLMINANCTTITTEGGTQNHYRAVIPNCIHNSSYSYRLINGSDISDWYTFSIRDLSQSTDFILFGDIQDEANGTSGQMFRDIASLYPNIDFWAFVGDLAERPTDYYWQIVFDALQPHALHIPIIACPGNHEHRKGIRKQLDERWSWMFGQPQLDKPTDFAINLPLLHITALNTDGLFWPWDYIQKKKTLTRHMLSTTCADQWNILLMHHPIYPGSIGRNNYMLRATFNPAIKENNIHLVFYGHDHTYARRISTAGTSLTTPIYIQTNSSNKYYLSNCDRKADKVACGLQLYTHVHITPDTLQAKTYIADTHELYDEIICIRKNDTIQVLDNGIVIPEKIILPEYFKKESKRKQREKFLKRKNIRESNKQLAQDIQ